MSIDFVDVVWWVDRWYGRTLKTVLDNVEKFISCLNWCFDTYDSPPLEVQGLECSMTLCSICISWAYPLLLLSHRFASWALVVILVLQGDNDGGENPAK